jgi:hypothetical protein
MPGRKAVALIAASFVVRLSVLMVVSYLLYRFSDINLLFFLLSIALGFTTVLFISIKNWLT